MSENSTEQSFIGIHPQVEGECKYVVVPVPYEKTVSYGHGTAKGPAAVIDASYQLELYDEELGVEQWKEGIATAPAVDCNGPDEEVFKRMEDAASALIDGGKLPFFIGGEHSISQALTKPFIDQYPDISILHIDAHADLRKTYRGSERSHACAMYPASRRCKVVQVGIRSIGDDEQQFVNTGNVKTFLDHENRDMKLLIPKVLSELTDTVYLSIDVDGFDPAVFPATGTPQPGGLSWYDGIDLLREVCLSKRVVGCDVVEIAPVPHSNITEFAGAKLIYRLIGYLSSSRKN